MKLFEPTGTIECRKFFEGGKTFADHYADVHLESEGLDGLFCECPTYVESEWKGGRIIALSGQLIKHARRNPTSDFYSVGRDRVVIGSYRLLLLGIKVTPFVTRCDTYIAMLDSPLAVCAKMYRQGILALLCKVIRVEAYFRSYGIPELVMGQIMPATNWLAARLL
jgi:hypothetical protein